MTPSVHKSKHVKTNEMNQFSKKNIVEEEKSS
jgi:hypothetical protein